MLSDFPTLLKIPKCRCASVLDTNKDSVILDATSSPNYVKRFNTKDLWSLAERTKR